MAMFEVAISDLRASLSLARPPEDLDGVLSPSSLLIQNPSTSSVNRIRLEEEGEREGGRTHSAHCFPRLCESHHAEVTLS